MTKENREAHMWTKEQLKSVAELWSTTTTKELCEKFNIEYMQLNYIVHEMRKAGMDLPKKHKIGNLQGLIREVMAELK